MSSFANLALERGWREGSQAYYKNRNRALVKDLNEHFGGCSKLEGLQQICADVGVDETPTTVTQCERVSVAGVTPSLPAIENPSIDMLRRYRVRSLTLSTSSTRVGRGLQLRSSSHERLYGIIRSLRTRSAQSILRKQLGRLGRCLLMFSN